MLNYISNTYENSDSCLLHLAGITARVQQFPPPAVKLLIMIFAPQPTINYLSLFTSLAAVIPLYLLLSKALRNNKKKDTKGDKEVCVYM